MTTGNTFFFPSTGVLLFLGTNLKILSFPGKMFTFQDFFFPGVIM